MTEQKVSDVVSELLKIDYSNAKQVKYIQDTYLHSIMDVDTGSITELKDKNIKLLYFYQIAFDCYRISQARYKYWSAKFEMRYRALSKSMLDIESSSHKVETKAKADASNEYGEKVLEWELKYRFWQSVIDEMDRIAKRIDSSTILLGIERKIYQAGFDNIEQDEGETVKNDR